MFSFHKKDAEAVPVKRGSRRSSRTSAHTARGGGEYSEHKQFDPLLPEKQRARRRLVGSLALVLMAVIILPMTLAPERKQADDDIAIQIPGKDGNSPHVSVNPQAAAAAAPSDPLLNWGEEAVGSSTLAATASKSAPASMAVPPSSVSVTQTSAKAQQQNSKVADPIAQFAQNNAPVTLAAKPDTHDIAQKSASNGKYLVRIGAFSTQDRAQAWLVKLKLMNVPSYIVKRTVGGRELYLLRAGPFLDRTAAEAAGEEIRAVGLTAQVAETG